jgi:HEAT repeat protein
MTLKRLVTTLGILVVLAGAGIMSLWQYAHSSSGRARIIIAQLKGDTFSLSGWMLTHHLVQPVYSASWGKAEDLAAENEMIKLGPRVLPVVIDALHDDNRVVRMMAVRTCGEFRDSSAIQPLAQRMREETSDPAVQDLCLVSLVEIGPEAYGPLLDAAKEGNSHMRWSVPETVAQIWGAQAVPQLVEFLDNSDGSVRWSAASELARFKDKRATDALVRHLEDGDANVARSSAIALGDIRDSKAIPALLKTLQNTHAENRTRIPAAGALARMGRDDGLSFLLVMVKSPKLLERSETAGELGTNGIKGTLEPLLFLLDDSDFYVRRTAVYGLGEVHDPRAIPAIKKFLNDPDPEARKTAARALQKLEVKTPASQSDKP